MRVASVLSTGLVTGVLFSAVYLSAQDQSDQEQTAKELPGKGLPPRAAASEYQAQEKAVADTIGAEFAGHSVPTPDPTYLAEDVVGVEAGLFGPPGTHPRLTRYDFSLRVNGKKTVL